MTPQKIEVFMANGISNSFPDRPGMLRLKDWFLNGDNTGRHIELQVFRESESYFRKIINSAPVALILTDMNGRCLFVNECWRDLSGLNLQQSIGSGWQKAVHPDDVGKIGLWFYPGEKTGTDPATECRLCSTSGDIKWVDLKAAPLYGDDGIMIGFITSFSDITHRKTEHCMP